MKKHFKFLSLAALLTATALISCQKELEMDLPSESEDELELADEGTRAEYVTSSSYLKLEDSKYIANPEKGLYKQYDIFFDKESYDNDEGIRWALEIIDKKCYPIVDNFTFSSFKDGTLVLLQFYIRDYLYEDLNPTAKNRIDGILNNVKNANKKAIVRFSYSNDSSSEIQEPKYEQLLRHISQQVGPIVNKYKDIIYVFQAGFIGTWGEWYYFTEPKFDTDKYGFNYRKDVVTQMLAEVPGRMVALRTPKYKRMYLHEKSDYQYNLNKYASLSQPNADENAHYRLSFYNDVFMYDDKDEMGTFPTETDRKMWLNQSPYLAIGGETANNFPTKTDKYGNTVQDVEMTNKMKAKDPVKVIKQYHYSYLHKRTNSPMYQYWMTLKNKDNVKKEIEIQNNLGYCLWLTSFKTTTESNGYTYFKFSIKNSGAAPVIYKRPISLVLLDKNNNNVKVLASSAISKKNLFVATYQDKTRNYSRTSEVADIRRIAPDDEVFYACRISTELINSYRNKKGAVKVALWMPDQSYELQSNPNYSIHLCNKETSSFTWKNGYNVIYQFK